jgi:enoyl-CoA hydratase/carnithine racemase
VRISEMTREHSPILTELLDGGIAKVVLNNPPLNVVTVRMSERLLETMKGLEGDESVRAVVLTGAGHKAFCAGADIKEFPSVRDRVVEKKLARENEAFGAIESLSKPVVAAIEGLAFGGGCEIALACDLRLAAEDARFAFPEVKLGVLPGSGGLYRLPELVGPARALELMYLGEPISAGEAKSMGLLNRVVPKGRALEHAIALAREIARRPREAVAAIKQGIRESSGASRAEAVRLTLELSERVFMTDDAVEGYEAFVEKREPRFGGMG